MLFIGLKLKKNQLNLEIPCQTKDSFYIKSKQSRFKLDAKNIMILYRSKKTKNKKQLNLEIPCQTKDSFYIELNQSRFKLDAKNIMLFYRSKI